MSFFIAFAFVFSPFSVIEDQELLEFFSEQLEPGGQILIAGECEDLNEVGRSLSDCGFTDIMIQDRGRKGVFEAWKE